MRMIGKFYRSGVRQIILYFTLFYNFFIYRLGVLDVFKRKKKEYKCCRHENAQKDVQDDRREKIE